MLFLYTSCRWFEGICVCALTDIDSVHLVFNPPLQLIETQGLILHVSLLTFMASLLNSEQPGP